MLSVAWQRLARPSSSTPSPQDLNPRLEIGTPPIAPALLCALVSNQNVVRLMHSGLSQWNLLQLPNVNLKPDRPLKQGNGRKQKTHWRTSFRLGCRIDTVLPHVYPALTKPAHQWVYGFRLVELQRVTSSLLGWIIHIRNLLSTGLHLFLLVPPRRIELRTF
jgi:hypothetical protein